MPVFTDERTRISLSIPDGWLVNRASSLPDGHNEYVAAFRSMDDVLRLNIMVGDSLDMDTVEQNRQLFQQCYAGSILRECTVEVDGVEHFAGIYAMGGLIHKRYVIIRGGMEYAIACAACLGTLDEFEQMAEPVFDNIVSSLEFLQ